MVLDNKKEVIYSLSKKDFIVQPFKGSGAGGQHRNKVSTAIRIKHAESGAIGECQEHKSQLQNRKVAFRRLIAHPKFKIWHAKKVREFDRNKTIEQEVEEAMVPTNLKVEIKNTKGQWRDEHENET